MLVILSDPERREGESKDLLLLFVFMLVILSAVEGPAVAFASLPTHKSTVPHPLRVLCEMGGIPQSSTIHVLKGRGFNRAATPSTRFFRKSTHAA
jgi:hypothetical protein